MKITDIQRRRIAKNIGVRIGDARRSRGLTQAELAKAVGDNRVTIANIERGNPEYLPTIVHLYAIARALGIGTIHLPRLDQVL